MNWEVRVHALESQSSYPGRSEFMPWVVKVHALGGQG